MRSAAAAVLVGAEDGHRASGAAGPVLGAPRVLQEVVLGLLEAPDEAALEEDLVRDALGAVPEAAEDVLGEVRLVTRRAES